jgi:hypothetical protein
MRANPDRDLRFIFSASSCYLDGSKALCKIKSFGIWWLFSEGGCIQWQLIL